MTNKHKPLLIVIAGPNGSGKTTITSKLLRHEWLEDALYINPDNVARDLLDGGLIYRGGSNEILILL